MPRPGTHAANGGAGVVQRHSRARATTGCSVDASTERHLHVCIPGELDCIGDCKPGENHLDGVETKCSGRKRRTEVAGEIDRGNLETSLQGIKLRWRGIGDAGSSPAAAALTARAAGGVSAGAPGGRPVPGPPAWDCKIVEGGGRAHRRAALRAPSYQVKWKSTYGYQDAAECR